MSSFDGQIVGMDYIEMIKEKFGDNFKVNDLSDYSLIIDNGNYDDMNDVIRSTSTLILQYIDNSNEICLNIFENKITEVNTEIKTKIIYGVAPINNIMFIRYEDMKIKVEYTIDREKDTISNKYNSPYREVMKFTFVDDNLDNKKKLLTLNKLTEEILATHYKLVTHCEAKSYILGKHNWVKNSCSFTHKTFENLYFAEEIKTKVINKITTFLSEKDQYNRFGKNYKLTFILEGDPGTGKTSFIQSIANYFNLNIYHFAHDNSICDIDFVKNINAVKKENFILFIEDFDKLFVNIDEVTTETCPKNTGMSFSGLTNIFDGAFSKQGMITFITTNHISKINDIFKRSGRTDMIINFNNCKEDQIKGLIKHCYSQNMEETELNQLINNFYKKIKNCGYKISELSQYLFDNRHSPKEIVNNIDSLKELSNQIKYGKPKTAEMMTY